MDGRPSAEGKEPRTGAKGNTRQTDMRRTPSRASVSPGLERVRRAAKRNKEERFTALLHHVDVELLWQAYFWLKPEAAPGVDGVTWEDYEADLELRLEDLHNRVHRGAYRPRPSRRTYIPKADGKQRPPRDKPVGRRLTAIAALEDKIVQRAAVMVPNAIYEEDFLGFSVLQRHGKEFSMNV